MTEEQRPPNEVTPTTPEVDAPAHAAGSGVRASPTQEAPADAHLATPMAATPFERAVRASPPAAGDGVLPFVKPASVPAGAPAPATSDAPAAVGTESPAPGVGPPSPEATAVPGAVTADGSPPEGAAAPAPAPTAAPSAAPEVPPLPEGPSPWSNDASAGRLDASLLPSAGLEFLPSASASDDVPKPSVKPAPSAPRSRTPLYVALAVTVVVLAGAIVYFATRPSGGSNDPTSVGIGSDGQELGPEPDGTGDATAAPSGSGSAAPAAPRPAWRPRPKAKKDRGGRYVPDDL